MERPLKLRADNYEAGITFITASGKRTLVPPETWGYPDTLLSLAKVWVRMMADLKAVSIAHGDLQHGNVVVVGDQLRLIDYDNMFVPGLAGKQSNECGHRNY